MPNHFEYSVVVGFFRRDAADTNPSTIEAIQEDLGLIEQEYDTDKLLPADGKDLTQWGRFAHKLHTMNTDAPDGVTYRLLYLGRHGQSYHNIGITFYGDAAWDSYYCTFDQDPNVPSITYRDAHLTRQGRIQAQRASKLWHNLISNQKIPLPQTFYCSPLSRAMQTAQLTFSTLLQPSSPPRQEQHHHFHPSTIIIKESLREAYGIQTCDIRPTKSQINTEFPNIRVENTFTEIDLLHSPSRRETHQHHVRRVQELLDDIFSHDDNAYISLTSHGGTIVAIMQVVGHAVFSLPTGGVMPMLVRVKRVPSARANGHESDRDDNMWQAKPECDFDPKTAGKPGFRDISEFIEEIERDVLDVPLST